MKPDLRCAKACDSPAVPEALEVGKAGGGPTSYRALIDWQRRLRAQPPVYIVRIGRPPFGEDTGNLYASKEAAQVEVDWYVARGEKAYAALLGTMHDLQLSKERWQP